MVVSSTFGLAVAGCLCRHDSTGREDRASAKCEALALTNRTREDVVMRWIMVGTMALAVSTSISPARPDEYPNRPIHVVIGFAAGSGADILTRFCAGALAASTNRRITALPDLPTMEEAGVPDYHFSPWWAAYLAGGTPPVIAAKVETWMGAISKTEDAAKFLDTMAALPVIGDGSWVRARIASDRTVFDRLAAAAHLEPQ
jgi:tripartite-type tricarboxylate transporter receptor subunit TctC